MLWIVATFGWEELSLHKEKGGKASAVVVLDMKPSQGEEGCIVRSSENPSSSLYDTTVSIFLSQKSLLGVPPCQKAS